MERSSTAFYLRSLSNASDIISKTNVTISYYIQEYDDTKDKSA